MIVERVCEEWSVKMKSPLVEKIADILKEKDFETAADALNEINGLDCFGIEYFLHDIICERWVHRPKDNPFKFARDIWKKKETDVKGNKDLLKQVLEYPIAEINKAKINDFLWNVDDDYGAAKAAELSYRKHIESTEEFAYNFMAINRLIYIAKKTNSKDTDSATRERLLIKVLGQYDNTAHGQMLSLLKTAEEENVDTEYVIECTEKVLGSFADNSYNITIIGKFCDLLENLYCKKNKWQKKKCITEPKLIEIRRRKVLAIMRIADYSKVSNVADIMRRVHHLKEVVNILKTIYGTESERKKLLKEIDELEKKMIADMPVIRVEQDNRESVERLIKQLEVLDKKEAICYFAAFIPLPEKKRVEDTITNSMRGLSDLFQIGILGKDGKAIAKSKPIKNGNDEINEGAFQDKLEHKTAEYMSCFAQIMVGNTLNYIRTKFIVEETDIREIVENSIIVPEDRREAYIKGLMAGFSGDFITALYILIPQVENSIRELAIECGEPVYNLNEDGIEESKTMHAVLELKGVEEKLDADFLLALKTIFCSKFGFNMRNNIAHGLLSDNQFQSYNALYTWWFILKMCYMFCGKLRINNRKKVNDKLKKLSEEKDK